MTSRDFAYWLQGFFEISENKEITENQTQIIKNHLNMVFKHEIDPSFGDDKHQEVLQNLHDNFIDKPDKKPNGNHTRGTILKC